MTFLMESLSFSEKSVTLHWIIHTAATIRIIELQYERSVIFEVVKKVLSSIKFIAVPQSW